MSSTNKIRSIQRENNSNFLLFTIIFFILGISSTIAIINQTGQQIATKEVRQWAHVISQQSVKLLLANDHSRLNDKLQTLNSVVSFNYIYIYKLTKNKKNITLFSHYKRGTKDIHLLNLKQIKSLSAIKFLLNYAELSMPIKNGNNLLGYVYIQISLTRQNEMLIKLSSTILIIALFVLFCTYFVASKYNKKIFRYILQLTERIQIIAQQKDFSQRCHYTPYLEINNLVQNINRVLSRTERYITRQIESEKQVTQLNKNLEEKINQRTEALKDSNHELLSTLETLHQYQGQLVENEKMASLGDMVAGVAHEVNTPIGLGVTSSSLLADQLNTIDTAFKNKTLKSSQLKKFLIDGNQNIDIIIRNLNRAADLITSFKQVAVDQSSSENRHFNFKLLLNEILITLSPQFKNTLYKVIIHCPDDLSITSKPSVIDQIFVNLINNSIIHGFNGRNNGTITITVILLKSQLNITYCDDGVGVDPQIREKIFAPFVTTRRSSGGSGLGMHLVYNLITQALNGTISLENKKQQGVLFDINFPIQL